MIGSLVTAGLLLAILGWALQHAAGTEGQVVASYGYWYVDPTAKIADTIILAPSMLAVAITTNPLSDPADRYRLYPQRFSDRVQLLYRRHSYYGGDEPRSLTTGVGEQSA